MNKCERDNEDEEDDGRCVVSFDNGPTYTKGPFRFVLKGKNVSVTIDSISSYRTKESSSFSLFVIASK